MKISITGNTGFIGSALIAHLSKNNSINLFIFERNKYSLAAIDSLNGFVQDKDVIVHLAGATHTELATDYYSVNTFGTRHLPEAIRLYGKPDAQFVFVSSSAVYEEKFINKKLSEKNSRTIPRNHYGMSKKFAEELIGFYFRQYNLRNSILRIANTYGPGNKIMHNGIIALLIDKIYSREPITTNGDRTQFRDFIFIDDVIHAFSKILTCRKRSLLVNICSGKEVSVIELIKKIEKLLKKKEIINFNNKYTEKGYWIGNPTKAKSEIDFLAITDIDTGLRKTVTNYMENKNL